jgi:hypothetical protein
MDVSHMSNITKLKKTKNKKKKKKEIISRLFIYQKEEKKNIRKRKLGEDV